MSLGNRSRVAIWCHSLLRLLYQVCQRLMTLDVTHLMRLDHDKVQLPLSEVPDCSFRFLTAADVNRLSQEPSNELSEEFAQRIALRGDRCFAALAGDQLAAYAWYAHGSVEPEHNRGATLNSGVGLSFPSEMAFMYKGFTHPEFRGRGLYGHVNGRALDELSREGICTVVATADWSNRSAMTSCWRVGYQDVGRIWRGGWGHWTTTLMPRAANAIGIRTPDEPAASVAG